MAARRTSKQSVKRTKTRETRVVEEPQQSSSWTDFFRFGESYTSLILGIVVVIIASILLVSFIKNRNIAKVAKPSQQIIAQHTVNISPEVSTSVNLVTTKTPQTNQVTTAPTRTATPTQTVKPSNTPAPTHVAAKPTTAPTKVVAVKATTASTQAPTVAPTTVPTAAVAQNAVPKNLPASYTVQSGDDLWKIAEKFYNSGYNYVDIAQANNIADPNALNAGAKLTLPKVPAKVATVGSNANVAMSNQITGSTYTVVKGDDLWNIAVRAYGDGYQWTKIAQANKLFNPSVIHSGNVLTIPRT